MNQIQADISGAIFPIEILSQIFFHAVVEPSSSMMEQADYFTWSALCRVCQFWNDVAVRHCGLWCYFIVINPIIVGQ
jgi:hypothetical protein